MKKIDIVLSYSKYLSMLESLRSFKFVTNITPKILVWKSKNISILEEIEALIKKLLSEKKFPKELELKASEFEAKRLEILKENTLNNNFQNSTDKAIYENETSKLRLGAYADIFEANENLKKEHDDLLSVEIEHTFYTISEKDLPQALAGDSDISAILDLISFDEHSEEVPTT